MGATDRNGGGLHRILSDLESQIRDPGNNGERPLRLLERVQDLSYGNYRNDGRVLAPVCEMERERRTARLSFHPKYPRTIYSCATSTADAEPRADLVRRGVHRRNRSVRSGCEG